MKLTLKKLKIVEKYATWQSGLILLMAAAGLSVVLYPALLNSATGGLLEKALPPSIYNAIHELRHLWGIPCH
ncbi:MAG: hypothetical protein QXN04_04325 [Pyrobaculum sp.]